MKTGLKRIASFEKLFGSSDDDDEEKSPRRSEGSHSSRGSSRGGSDDEKWSAEMRGASSISSDGNTITRKVSSIGGLLRGRSSDAEPLNEIPPRSSAAVLASPKMTPEEKNRAEMVNSLDKYMCWQMVDEVTDQIRTYHMVMAALRMAAGHLDREFPQNLFELYVPTEKMFEAVRRAMSTNSYRGERVISPRLSCLPRIDSHDNQMMMYGHVNTVRVRMLDEWFGDVDADSGDIFVLGGYHFDETHTLAILPKFMKQAQRARWDGRLRITANRNNLRDFPTMPVGFRVLVSISDSKK